MNIAKRLEALETIFIETDERRLLTLLARAVRGDAEAKAAIERECAAGVATRGVRNVCEIWLRGGPEELSAELEAQLDASE